MQISLTISGPGAAQALQLLRSPESGIVPVEDNAYAKLRKPLHSDLGDVMSIVGTVVSLLQLAVALYAIKGHVVVVIRRDDRELRLTEKESREDIERQLAQLETQTDSDKEPPT